MVNSRNYEIFTYSMTRAQSYIIQLCQACGLTLAAFIFFFFFARGAFGALSVEIIL